MAKRGRPRKTENKVVYRKYYSKKLGTYVTKAYEYNRDVYKNKKTTRSYVNKFTTKSGKTTKKFEKFLSKYNSISDRQFLKDIRDKYVSTGKVLTEARALYELSENKLYSALDNTGYSIEELAIQANTEPEDLTNVNNWDGSIFTNPTTGVRYQYVWTYTGTVLNVIN